MVPLSVAGFSRSLFWLRIAANQTGPVLRQSPPHLSHSEKLLAVFAGLHLYRKSTALLRMAVILRSLFHACPASPR